MSRRYYDRPLQTPAPHEPGGPAVQRNDVLEAEGPSPGDDPTEPGVQPRGEPQLDPARGASGTDERSEEARNQQATSNKSRAESGTP